MRLLFCFFLSLSITIISCKPSYDEPRISLEDYTVEDGFDLEMVASEPLLTAPVAIDFDSKGRIWVAEMTGFMVNLEGDGEDLPSGSIKILEDLDEDGIMDHAKTFLDSLVMPRALALVYGGLLYAESPNLWFVEIENDKPVNRVLVDSLYATVGNPEHQPNGLMMNLDNWIYNAKSNFRYQRTNGVWKKEPTTQRGQWGISHDNFGRLYYNNNSTQLLGDHILPNRLVRNKYFVPKKGVDETLTKDQRVYPLHAASVNRGYEEGVLNQDSLLVNVTAACGPLVYRGGMFPEDYDQNVFVCVPEVNLIKRNILSFYGDRVEAKQAWQGKEFLASTDEGFRPVNLATGPDGNMYVVDMHRGVIQHYAFLSPYLKKISAQKKLDTILDYGRILRVRSKDKPARSIPDLETLSGFQLVASLKDANGWVRDRAQQYLIHKNNKETLPELKEMALDNTSPLAQMHALYVLKGLNALSFDFLQELAQSGDPEAASHAIVLMEEYASDKNVPKAKDLFAELLNRNEPMLDLYLSTTMGIWAKYDQEVFFPIIYDLANKYSDKKIYQEAIVSGSEDVLTVLDSQLGQFNKLKDSDLASLTTESVERKRNDKPNYIYSTKIARADSRTNGAILFRQICASCHSSSGEGIHGLAPPLVGSEYISTHLEQLGLIILHGLKGPLKIKGELYDENHQMPGLKYNKNLSDKDISDIISYVTNAFSVNPKGLKPEKIKELRDVKSKDGMEYTEEELYEHIGK
ncbi:c-type cytochrome [Arenibacter sp. BSSL-BM3]|uniref:C-type cytochrome n=1 Tax=Arenibacter arenosicollis TaxID=2762274 RepID=A0ABR7QMA9_9FLAO|nr:c-type cytochrome [Arenibacter arenosicollis]MBC8768335.1 c-type cytochrome [Arenibacter arenosicollis]